MSRGTYYRSCPECGSNLDPGERCTCGGSMMSEEIFVNSINPLSLYVKKNRIDRVCDDCKKQRTNFCPNSYLCYSTPDKPYFVKR